MLTFILYLTIGLVALYAISAIHIAFKRGLRSIPGPFLARFSSLYRIGLVYHGEAPTNYRRLHEQYGPLVRVGPNAVSVSEADMVPIIYGIGSQFLKVWVSSILRWL